MRILKPGEYTWKETQGGTGWALLRHDPQHDTQTRLLRYTRGVTLPAVELDHTVEWLVLRGEARCGPLPLRRRGFYCWPMGDRRDGIVPGEEGYTVISFVSGPRGGMRKPAVAIESIDALPWEEMEPLPGAGALPTRTLNLDPASGAATRIVRIEPENPLPPVRPASVAELFVVEGTLTLEGERLPPTSYAALDPQEECGPLAAAGAPALLLVNTHGADVNPEGLRR